MTSETVIVKGQFAAKPSLAPVIMGVGLIVLGQPVLVGVLSYFFLLLGGVITIISLLCFLLSLGCKLVVTNKRISGQASFGKLVDLPLDSVSSITASAFNGIAIATSSGYIKFKFLKNRNEIYAVISDLLGNRQSVTHIATALSNADELRKYKELLDMGAITNEEYDAKKKKLLE